MHLTGAARTTAQRIDDGKVLSIQNSDVVQQAKVAKVAYKIAQEMMMMFMLC